MYTSFLNLFFVCYLVGHKTNRQVAAKSPKTAKFRPEMLWPTLPWLPGRLFRSEIRWRKKLCCFFCLGKKNKFISTWVKSKYVINLKKFAEIYVDVRILYLLRVTVIWILMWWKNMKVLSRHLDTHEPSPSKCPRCRWSWVHLWN